MCIYYLKQHLTLVEIFKLNSYYEEALIHAQFLVRIKPDFKKGLDLIKELQVLIKTRQEKCERCSSKNNNKNNNIAFNNAKGFSLFSLKLNSIVSYLTSKFQMTPSIYLQFSFHMFLLLLIFVIGILISLINVLFDGAHKIGDNESTKHETYIKCSDDSSETSDSSCLNKGPHMTKGGINMSNGQRKKSNCNFKRFK